VAVEKVPLTIKPTAYTSDLMRDPPEQDEDSVPAAVVVGETLAQKV